MICLFIFYYFVLFMGVFGGKSSLVVSFSVLSVMENVKKELVLVSLLFLFGEHCGRD